MSSWLTTMPRAERADTTPSSAGTAMTVAPDSTRPRVTRSDDELIAAPRHVDLAGFLERPDDPHDSCLRLFDGLQLHGAEQLDLFGQVRGCTLGHVLHNLVAHLRVDTLE